MKRVIAILFFLSSSLLGNSQPKQPIFDEESIKMKLLSMNSETSDFGPALIGDSLYFTSTPDIGNKSKKEIQNSTFYDLFVTRIDTLGNIPDRREVIRQFSDKYHNGPVAWCAATEELFITQSNYEQSGPIFKPFRTNYYNLQIVIAKPVNGVWKVIEKFPYNNPHYSVGHPAISSQGDTLIFCSNQPGGIGGTDLYLSIRKNGKWGKPVNLGSKINSPGKDEFPFLSNHGDLIFSSDGRGGFGGLDLYTTKLKDPNGEIHHFNRPINSQYDDFSMIILPEKNVGYLSSNRPGYGGDDIYKLTYKRTKESFLQLTILDAKSQKPISEAEIEFSDSIQLKSDELGEITRMISDNLSLNLKIKAQGYFNEAKTIRTKILKSGAVLKDTVQMNLLDKERYVVHNLYFDYNKWNLLAESIKDLDHLVIYLLENPQTKVNIGAHTDSRGTHEYNEKLSELRLKSVNDYLLKKGIDADRIDGRYYAETIPVNNCVDPSNCTPQELRLNRRVEFYIAELGKSEIVDQGDKGDYTETAQGEDQTSGYSILIGSYRIKSNAEKIINQLKTSGYETEMLDYNDLFLVQVNFKDSQSAKEQYKKLKEKYQGAVLL